MKKHFKKIWLLSEILDFQERKRLERAEVVQNRKSFILQEELAKRCKLSSRRYKMMGDEKAKKLRAEAYSADLRRWL